MDSTKYLGTAEFLNLTPLDLNPGIVKCEISVAYEGKNRNGSYIDHEAMESLARSLRGTPIVGFFDEKTQGHIRRRIVDEGITDDNEKVVYMRACVIGVLENACAEAFIRHEEDIMNGTMEGCLIDNIEPKLAEAYKKCTILSKQKIYKSKPVLDVELSGFKIMATLMEAMTEAAVNPSRFYSRQLISRVSSQYDIDSPDLETRIMAVIDYISGMTDVYALDIYQKINGISLPIV